MKTLNILEIEQVAGGLDDTTTTDDIVVYGTKPKELDFSIYQNSFGSFGTFDSFLPGSEMLLVSGWIPVFPFYLGDSDIEDFKEFLDENTDIDPNTVMIDTFKFGEDKYIIEWDANGKGSIYRVTDHTFTDDEFHLFGNINVTGQTLTSATNANLGAGLSPTGPNMTVTIGTTHGYAVTFTYTGTGH